METMGWRGLASGLPRIYWLLWAGQLINRVGSLVIPMITAYLTQVRGLPLETAGWTVAMFGAGAFLGNLAGGALADRLGRRRTLLLSLGTGALAMLGLGQAQAPAALMAWCFAVGLFGEMFRPAAQAAIADVVPPAQRMRAFTLQYWAVNLGFAISALVAGALATTHFAWLFAADAATTFAFAVVVAIGVPETLPAERAHGPLPGSVLTPFLDRTYVPLLALTYVCALVMMQHLVPLQAFLLAQGLDTAAYGKAIALNGVIIVLFQPLMSRLVEGRNRLFVLALAALLIGAGFGLLAFSTGLLSTMATVAIWTFGEMLMAPVNSAMVADAAPPHLRGRYQGALSLTWAVAFSSAPLLGTRLASSAGFTALWALCAVLGAAAAAGYWVLASRAHALARPPAPQTS